MQSYILFLGPPFVGKSTQMDKLILAYTQAKRLSTSDILRRNETALTNVADETGKRLTVAELNARGLYTDAETVLSFVREELKEFGGAPIVSDSYPRSVAQLSDIKEKLNMDISAVFYLRTSSEENYWKIFERRRAARMYCEKCDRNFDPVTNPASNGMCPKDNVQVAFRKDDNPETARKRFNSYLKNVGPLVEAMRGSKAFHEVVIDSDGSEISPAEIFAQIEPVVRSLYMPLEARVLA